VVVSGFGFRGLVFQLPGSGFCFRFRVPGVSGFGVSASGSGFRVFQVPASGFRVSGFGSRVSCLVSRVSFGGYFYLTQCINYMFLESQLPHKTVK